jgi:hypothetical protein
MRVSLRLADHIKGDIHRRGLAAEIAKHCGIERHTVASWLNNTAKYVSLESLAKLADYLVEVHGADRGKLPGALLARDPDNLLDALSQCARLDFYIGTRVSAEWPGSDYVMSADLLLQAQLLNRLARFLHTEALVRAAKEGDAQRQDSPDNAQSKPSVRGPLVRDVAQPLIPEFHLLSAPTRKTTGRQPGEKWSDVCAEATRLYEEAKSTPQRALIALGSTKSNPIMELMFANVFGGKPFASEDGVARARLRSCPMMFRYRDEPDQPDPQPPSCCGGLRLAADTPTEFPGIYCESDRGKWEGYPWDHASADVAFVFYSYQPHRGHLELACGGFSGRATRCLTTLLADEQRYDLTAELGAPQYNSKTLQVSLNLVVFRFDPQDTNYDRFRDNRQFQRPPELVRVPDAAILRRLPKPAENG